MQIRSLRLLTNNPNKIDQLQEYGLTITARVPLVATVNAENITYLTTKVQRMRHLLYLPTNGEAPANSVLPSWTLPVPAVGAKVPLIADNVASGLRQAAYQFFAEQRLPFVTVSFPRYLAAKKSVDDRALNQHVWNTLHQQLHARRVDAQQPLRVLEIGAGIGTMVERALTRGLFTQVDYTLVDAMAENITTARQRVPAWALAQGFTVQEMNEAMSTVYQINRPASALQSAVQLALTLHTADCFDFAARPEQAGQYDLLIAHAFLDLVDIPCALPRLQCLLRPQALCYLTINFDGGTLLQPEIDPPFDTLIEALYHETMNKRIVNGEPSGDSRNGCHLFGHLRKAGIDILAAGSSDWVVFADKAGYPADEAYFLHFIIQTLGGALCDNPALDQARFAGWIAERHAQIERGELVYIAHQLDFLGQALV